MKAWLVPQSGTKSAKIPIEGRVFAVGRKEPAFESLSSEDLAILSKRHAQFFEEENQVYLVDLGSDQGSRVNGELLLDRPMCLQTGDVIAFGALEFRIDTGKAPPQEALNQTEFVSAEDDNTEVLEQDLEAATEAVSDGLTGTMAAQESTTDVDGSSTEVMNQQVPDDNTLVRSTDRATKNSDSGLSIQTPRPIAGQKHSSAGNESKPGSRRWWLAIVLLPIILAAAYALLRVQPSTDNDTQQSTAVRPASAAIAMVESALEQGETDTLPARLLALVRSHTTDTELQGLLDDATQYSELLNLLEDGALLGLATLRGKGPLATTLFEEAARSRIDPAMGTPALQQRLAQAAQAWSSGQLVAAINLLIQIPDNAFAAAMLNHYQSVVEDYETLNALSGSAAYPQAATTFYLGLNPLEDRFFWRRLAGDSETSQQSEFLTAAKQLEAAAALWASYQNNGRIDGRMRQGENISEAFRQRSHELREAATQLKAAAAAPSEMQGPSEPLFPALVNAEIEKQRVHLVTLQAFIPDAVLAEKLGMLNTEK